MTICYGITAFQIDLHGSCADERGFVEFYAYIILFTYKISSLWTELLLSLINLLLSGVLLISTLLSPPDLSRERWTHNLSLGGLELLLGSLKLLLLPLSDVLALLGLFSLPALLA
jgi:hypothetical protein